MKGIGLRILKLKWLWEKGGLINEKKVDSCHRISQ